MVRQIIPVIDNSFTKEILSASAVYCIIIISAVYCIIILIHFTADTAKNYPKSFKVSAI